MITDEHPELRHEEAAHEAVQGRRVGFLRELSANIVDPLPLLAAVAVVAVLFAISH
jgi:hypothetical protein